MKANTIFSIVQIAKMKFFDKISKDHFILLEKGVLQSKYNGKGDDLCSLILEKM